jgi:hypothetical protein
MNDPLLTLTALLCLINLPLIAQNRQTKKDTNHDRGQTPRYTFISQFSQILIKKKKKIEQIASVLRNSLIQ